MSVILQASGLASKWGFLDGDILDEIMWNRYGDDEPDLGEGHHLGFDHEVLARAVERYLLPAMEREGMLVKTYRIGTIHNPIRIEDGEDQDGPWMNASVTVSVEQIHAIMDEVAAEAQNP